MKIVKSKNKTPGPLLRVFKVSLVFLAIVCTISFVKYEFFDVQHKIQKSINANLGDGRVDVFSDGYLIITVPINTLDYDEEATLRGVRGILKDLKVINPDISVVAFKFWTSYKLLEVTELYQCSAGMSNVLSTDWTQNMTYDEFKEKVNWMKK